MAIVRNSIKLSSGGGTEITVVANYSALPDPTTVTGEFYWAEASQGTSWLPGSLGGTYYNSGMYYSNGVAWQFMNVPYQATQATVNTGTNDNQFVTPNTLKNQNYLAPLASPALTGSPTAPTQSANDNSTKIATTAYADAKVADTITDGVTTIAPSQNAVFDALALKADKSTSAYKFKVNNTNATANETETDYHSAGMQAYVDTPTFTAGTAPSGSADLTYNWQRIGNWVKANFTFYYPTAGATVTQILIPIPSDMPDPIVPTGFTGASMVLYLGQGTMISTQTSIGVSASDMYSYLVRNAGDTDFEFGISATAGSYRVFRMTIEYPTS